MRMDAMGCLNVGVIRQARVGSTGVRIELLKDTIFFFVSRGLGHETAISANGNLCGLIFINSINMHPAILNVLTYKKTGFQLAHLNEARWGFGGHYYHTLK